jgi:hypothetical protein
MRLQSKLPVVGACCACVGAFGDASGTVRPLGVTENRPAASAAEIVVLGCVHDLHRTHARYSTAELTKIIDGLHPQMILIEYPVDWFEEGKPRAEVLKLLERHTGSETEAAWAYCRDKRATCLPYDVKGRNDYYQATNFLQREEALFRAVLKEIDAKQPLAADAIDRHFNLKELCQHSSAEVINSPLCDEIVRTEHEFREQATKLVLGAGSDIPDKEFWAIEMQEWTDRNRSMADNICAVARENPGKRILVTVGFEHRYALKPLLTERCATAALREYWQVPGASAP